MTIAEILGMRPPADATEAEIRKRIRDIHAKRADATKAAAELKDRWAAEILSLDVDGLADIEAKRQDAEQLCHAISTLCTALEERAGVAKKNEKRDQLKRQADEANAANEDAAKAFPAYQIHAGALVAALEKMKRAVQLTATFNRKAIEEMMTPGGDETVAPIDGWVQDAWDGHGEVGPFHSLVRLPSLIGDPDFPFWKG